MTKGYTGNIKQLRLWKFFNKFSKNIKVNNKLYWTEEKMNKKVIFNQDSWEEKVLNSNLPVMVDFWAEWCAPCHMIAPLIEKMAEEYQDKVKVGRLNVDENPDIAAKYKIRGIPTLLFFKNGQVVDQVVGVTPEYVLNKKLENLTNQ